MNTSATIGIVDDEPGMLRALSRLFRAKGFAIQTFQSSREFLVHLSAAHLDCVVLDVLMPELDGLEVQECLKRTGAYVPIIFLTGQGSIPMSVRAMKAGAVNFLTKPVDEGELMAAVQFALQESDHHRAEEATVQTLRAHMEQLTPRELEVWRHVISGKLNKQIAADLGVGEQTIKVHRMRLMEKMDVVSVPELLMAAQRLGVAPAVPL